MWSYILHRNELPSENPVVYFPSHWFHPMIEIAHILKRPPCRSCHACVRFVGQLQD